VLLLLLLSDPLSRRALRLLFDYILKNGEREYLSLANRGCMPLFTDNPRRTFLRALFCTLAYTYGIEAFSSGTFVH
jgi:hypothetical protein